MVKLIQKVIEKEKPNIVLAGGWNLITFAFACLDVPVVADAADERVLASLRALRFASSPKLAAYALRDVLNSYRWDRHYLPVVRCSIFASPVTRSGPEVLCLNCRCRSLKMASITNFSIRSTAMKTIPQ